MIKLPKTKKDKYILFMILLIILLSGFIIYKLTIQKDKSESEDENADYFINTENINEEALIDIDESTEPGTVLKEIPSTNENFSLKLHVGEEVPENYISINGEAIKDIKNVTNLNIDLTTGKIYFNKFEVKDGHSESLGKVYSISEEDTSPNEVYDFGDVELFNFKVQDNKLIYAVNNSTLGLIDLTTKNKVIEKSVSELGLTIEKLYADENLVQLYIHDVGNDSFVIGIVEQETRFYRISNQDFSILE